MTLEESTLREALGYLVQRIVEIGNNGNNQIKELCAEEIKRLMQVEMFIRKGQP